MLTTLHSHFFVVPTSTNTLVIIICQSASRQAIVVLPCLDTSGPAHRRLDSRKGPAERVAPRRHGHRPTRVRAQPQRACHHSDASLSSQLLVWVLINATLVHKSVFFRYRNTVRAYTNQRTGIRRTVSKIRPELRLSVIGPKTSPHLDSLHHSLLYPMSALSTKFGVTPSGASPNRSVFCPKFTTLYQLTYNLRILRKYCSKFK